MLTTKGGGPQPAAKKLNRTGSRKQGRPSSAMKPEQFAPGERAVQPFKPLNRRVDVDKLVDGESPAAAPTLQIAHPRPRFSSSFLQPEQFFAELRVNAGDLPIDITRRLSCSESITSTGASFPNPQSRHEEDVITGPDLAKLCQPANSVPTLELCFEGKPAPAPAHLRGKTNSTKRLSNASTGLSDSPALPGSDKNSEAVVSPHSPEEKLQRSSSQGSGRFTKIREKLVRSLSGRKENSSSPGTEGGDAGSTQGCARSDGANAVKPSGRLRRALRWGSSRTGSMDFLRKKSGKNAQIGAGRVYSGLHNAVEGRGSSVLDQETLDCSPRSSVSSVSTAYSEVSSRSHSYKQAHKKIHKSEVVKSKPQGLRVHQKLQTRTGEDEEEEEEDDDGVFEALRQDVTAASKTEDGEKILNGSEKNAMSKLVAKHKRNSTWDVGKLSLTDHIFSPKQPRLPTRDAHVLLAPPKRLTGGTRDFDVEGSMSVVNTPEHVEAAESRPVEHEAAASRVADESIDPATSVQNVVSSPLLSSLTSVTSDGSTSPGRSGRRVAVNHTVACEEPELPAPSDHGPGDLVSLERSSFRAFPGFSSPSPLPSRAETPNILTSSGLSDDASPGVHSVSNRPETLILAGGGGVQTTSSGDTIHGASPSPISPGLSASPGGAGFQSVLMAGLDASSRTHAGIRGRNSVEDSLSSSSSVQATKASSQDPGSRPHSDSATSRPSVERVSPDKHNPVGGGNALPLAASPRPPGLSFEQIVAGRGRSPPTDNTLMKFFFKCREIEHLNKFLALQKRRFLDSSNADEKCFHMILSEAGAGLSSMVSTLCTAWLLENTMASVTSAKWHPIPVMNMSQKEMWQHRDAAWLFHVCGIDANAVLFLDEITPTNETVISGRVKRAVIGQDILVAKDEVASSCTIVSEKFRQEAPKLLQSRYMMTLLLAGILVDTHNLLSGSARDKQQATIMLVGAGSLGRNGFYNHLMNIRDEDYVTSFIKEIYGDSNALTGEKPAQLSSSIEQSKAVIPSLRNEKMPASLSASKVSSKATAPFSPPPLPSEKPITKPSRKSEVEVKGYDDTKQSPSKKEDPQSKARAPQNSKISFALRLLRNRSSVH